MSGRPSIEGRARLVADPAELFVVQVGDDMVFPLSPASIGELAVAIAHEAGEEELAALGRSLIDIGQTTSRTGIELVTDDRLARRRAALTVSERDSVARAQDVVLAHSRRSPTPSTPSWINRCTGWPGGRSRPTSWATAGSSTSTRWSSFSPDVGGGRLHRHPCPLLGELVRQGAVDGLRSRPHRRDGGSGRVLRTSPRPGSGRVARGGEDPRPGRAPASLARRRDDRVRPRRGDHALPGGSPRRGPHHRGLPRHYR